jgi:hypothetical protein
MTDKEQRISDIVDKLDSLTLEANVLTHELREPTKPTKDINYTTKRLIKEEEKKIASTTNDFVKGEKVIITNGYKGKKGSTGTVTHTTKTQVTFKDESGKTYVRKFTNVKRI